ncbi:hypothetical protein M422DRAFT_221782 [Sphaerobolus stellatus SS14]|nr:hypothetical protein M422DRAFT_221782 [Sphaerobolus stellatus SS14]
MTQNGSPSCFATYIYHESSGVKLALDLYLPPLESSLEEGPGAVLRPAVIYFHGGGLTVGHRKAWFPHWMYKRAINSGFAFISVEYRLLPPATGFEILEDILNLFHFLDSQISEKIKVQGRSDSIDMQRIVVAGSSAGGLCAYVAGVHAKPKPKAVLSLYGMGGDFFTPHYLIRKTKPFFRGRELLDTTDFEPFLYPASQILPPISESPLTYHGPDHIIPGYPSNPRMLLARLFLQLGIYLDYYTGKHEPSLSIPLREILNEKGSKKIELIKPFLSAEEQKLFPQLYASAFPATFFIHGSNDTAVPVFESQSLSQLLQDSGVPTTLEICDEMEHSFDYEIDAEQRWSNTFDKAFEFIEGCFSSV